MKAAATVVWPRPSLEHATTLRQRFTGSKEQCRRAAPVTTPAPLDVGDTHTEACVGRLRMGLPPRATHRSSSVPPCFRPMGLLCRSTMSVWSAIIRSTRSLTSFS